MKKSLLALSLSSALLVPMSALAAGAEPGFYLGAAYTQATWDIAGVDKDADLGVLSARGGYQINDYVAVEGRLGTGVQDDKVYGVKVELQDTYGVYAKLGVPTEIGLYPYALLGVTHVKVKASVPGYSASDSDSDVSYGVGVDYWFNRSVSAGLEYANYYDKNSDKITGLTLGVNYKF